MTPTRPPCSSLFASCLPQSILPRAASWGRTAWLVLAWWTLCAMASLAGLALPTRAWAGEAERVQVADPYLELRTGPGRGYPVFHVAEREEWIEIELRRTDWFKVRTARGTEGWVQRQQLERTLTEAGGTRTFRDIALDDYLRRRVELGVGWGRFKGEPMLRLWTGYKLSEPLSAELVYGQVQGTFSGSDFWHAGLLTEPWADQRLSPYLAVGVGRFRNAPNASLVDAVTTRSKLAQAALGVRLHLGERFIARLDYSLYTAFLTDNRSDEYRAITAGFSFFF